eukprot:1159398-Pelagomonas_calceolata.AAC.25
MSVNLTLHKLLPLHDIHAQPAALIHFQPAAAAAIPLSDVPRAGCPQAVWWPDAGAQPPAVPLPPTHLASGCPAQTRGCTGRFLPGAFLSRTGLQRGEQLQGVQLKVVENSWSR